MKKDFKPKGYNSVSPYFIVDGAQLFIEILSKIFQVKELRRYDLPDGSIMHMELQLEDTVIMLSESSEKYRQSNSLCTYTLKMSTLF
jgi:uncharacterized glyoxalase superfamily protein PhnB